ncbi:MAG: hypothetical protein BWY21_01166 [Parcubacteria group bacterium ADurb.Bin216]|nr:MAG: hypothetical protein BWY21_01166 [Parcubacteria group bacterium ADurb.Bin216]
MATPTNLSFPTVAYNSIILNWTPGTGSTNTLIVRKQGSIPTSRTDGTTIYEDNGNAFIDTGLTDNTNYCYALYATDNTEYTEALTGCQATVQAYSSCSELKALGVNTNGVYPIKVNGNTFNAYCDMITDGGGWTLVLAQYEDDPVTNWNEGIQGDYDPSLATRKGFALNASQIPTHNQVAFGKDLNPTELDYFDFTYYTGNIPIYETIGRKTKNHYHLHRHLTGFYNGHDPESSYYSNTYPEWQNTLTIDKLGGINYTWAFSPNHPTVTSRGFAMNGSVSGLSNSYAWTVWVRNVYAGEDMAKKRAITIANGSGVTLSDYQIKVTIPYYSGMRGDFGDVRFGTIDGSPLSYWNTASTPNSSATYFVRVPSIPIGTSTIYLYYGNSSAVSQSDPNMAMELYDHFNTLDTTKWNFTGAVLDGHTLRLSNPSAGTKVFSSKKVFNYPVYIYYSYRKNVSNVQRLRTSGYVCNCSYSDYGLFNNTLYINGSWTSGEFSSYLPINTWLGLYEIYVPGGQSWIGVNGYSSIGGARLTGNASKNISWALNSDGGGGSSDISFDYVYVKKYVSVEPSFSIGLEESN